MASRRMLKAAEAIREVVSMAILTEIRDPRVQNVTVTGVEVSSDMRSAKVMVSVMGDEGRQHLCLKGLMNASGFLQSKIAKRLDTRYTPRLTFELDQGVKKSIEVLRILNELQQERELLAQQNSAESSADDSIEPPNEGQPSEGQPSEGQPSEGQPSEGQPSEGQPSDHPDN
ncbi:MAG: 30S ribosome-binding factor RbfA [Pirellulaceae bacterium]